MINKWKDFIKTYEVFLDGAIPIVEDILATLKRELEPEDSKNPNPNYPTVTLNEMMDMYVDLSDPKRNQIRDRHSKLGMLLYECFSIMNVADSHRERIVTKQGNVKPKQEDLTTLVGKLSKEEIAALAAMFKK